MTKINNRKGFTLIELVVAIAIMGILVSIVVPNLYDARMRARHVAFDAQVDQLYQAATLFTIDYPETHTNWNGLANEKARDVEITNVNMHEAWYLYLAVYPEDPTRPKGSTFSVEIMEDGEIRISPDSYGDVTP